ncbi:MAG: LuxR family transcriptional regulator, partial [Bacillus sp. (in: firmicutes)]|nr:LuxR family transcriptional regulator [Bacillus sp. (in: firmicutes)]
MLAADLEYFQDVQNAYATLTNLHCIITDKQGNPITQLNNDPNIFHLVYDQETFKEVLNQWTRDFSKINSAIVYDALPGVKVIICPISIQGEIEFFIFAGCLLES